VGTGSASTAPTPASALRRVFAEQIAAVYAGNPKVAAVLLGGSAARGHADRYSDIELFVIWREPPTEADRAMAIAAAGGDLVTLYPVEDSDSGPLWQDAWKIGRLGDEPFTGVEVDGSHLLVGTVERVLRAVIDLCDPDPTKQVAVGGILYSIPLHGAQLIAEWQTRAARYPDGLRLAVVRAHAQIEGLWRLDAYAARDNPVAGYQVLTAAHEDLLHVLLGLNRTYYSGFKSLTAVVRELRIAPQDLLERIRASYPLEVGRSKEMLTALVDETHDLVEAHLPEIDVERLREILRYDRPLWE
jgi:predicted nucleotidyltransferase